MCHAETVRGAERLYRGRRGQTERAGDTGPQCVDRALNALDDGGGLGIDQAHARVVCAD